MNTYKRHRFPPDIISYAVWLYYRFNLSHRDVEDLLAERGITVCHESIRFIADIGLFLSKGFDTELSKLSPELQVSGHDLQRSLTHTQLVTGVGFSRQFRQLCGSIHGGGDGLSLVDNAVE